MKISFSVKCYKFNKTSPVFQAFLNERAKFDIEAAFLSLQSTYPNEVLSHSMKEEAFSLLTITGLPWYDNKRITFLCP